MLKMSDENLVKLVTKTVSKDPQLRDKALKNGNAAVEEILGTLESMKGVKVIFHENTDAEVHIALPPLGSRDIDGVDERGLLDIFKTVVGIANKALN